MHASKEALHAFHGFSEACNVVREGFGVIANANSAVCGELAVAPDACTVVLYDSFVAVAECGSSRDGFGVAADAYDVTFIEGVGPWIVKNTDI